MNIDKCSVVRFSSRSSLLPYDGISPYRVNDENIKFVTSQMDLGILVDRSLKFHSHIAKTVRSVGGLMTNLLSSTLCRSVKFMMNLYVSHIRPKIEYACNVWNTGYIGDLKLLEGLQRRWTRSVEGLEDLPYDVRLQQLDLFSLQGRFLRSDLILVWRMVHGKCSINLDSMFSLSPVTVTRGHRYKLLVPRINLEVRRRFFAVRVVNSWNSLSDDTVEAASLEIFKRLLHRDLGQRLYNYH